MIQLKRFLLKLEREQNKVAILEEQMQAQRKEMEERMKALEKAMLQKFTDQY